MRFMRLSSNVVHLSAMKQKRGLDPSLGGRDSDFLSTETAGV